MIERSQTLSRALGRVLYSTLPIRHGRVEVVIGLELVRHSDQGPRRDVWQGQGETGSDTGPIATGVTALYSG